MANWLDKIFGNAPIQTLDLAPRDLKLAYNLSRVGISGRPQHPDTHTESLMSWHRRNELVYACIEKIAEAAIDPELKIEQKKGDVWDPIPEHPLRRLMKRPNPLDDEGSFLAAWLASEHIAGKFCAEIVRNRAGLPIQLWPLDPCKVFPIAGTGEDGNPIVGFEYRDGGRRVFLPARDVLYRHNRDLTTPFNGLSPLAVALGAVDSDTAQTDYVRAFFNNDGTPSGILKTEQRITKQDAEEMETRWTSKFTRFGSKRKGMAVLGQGVSYERTGANLSELESDNLRSQSESRICMVFGVPPLLVGAYVGLLHVNQRASAREAQSDFWVNKMSPLFKRLRTFLTWRMLTEFEGVDRVSADLVRVSWDMSQVMALQEDTDARHKRTLESFKAGGITLNEFRAEVGQEPDPDGDYYVRPYTVSAVDPEQAVREIPQGKPPAQLTDGSEKRKAVSTNGNGRKFHPLNILGRELDAVIYRASGLGLEINPDGHLTKAVEWEGLTLTREPNAVERLAVKALSESQEAGKRRLAATLIELRDVLSVEAVEELPKMRPADYFSLVLTVPVRLRERVLKNLRVTEREGREQVVRELGEQGKSTKADDDEDDLDELADLTVSRVANDVQSRAISSISTLATLGLARAELGKRLKAMLDDMSAQPAEAAAGAATNRALSLGRAAEMEDRADEIDRYQYSALLDVNTCSPCEAEDGKESDDPDELAPAPNPDCDGLDKCRCFVVAIRDTPKAARMPVLSVAVEEGEPNGQRQ